MPVKKGKEVVVSYLPLCDFCKEQGKTKDAAYDGKTTYGSWANMCGAHFKLYGTGLGVGRGQKLLLTKEERVVCRSTA